jgi:WD40 repeat protein
VEDHLEHAMAELSSRQKDVAAEMYRFLVTPSGTKIAHDVRDLAGYADVDEAEADDVLRRLSAERIVRSDSENGARRYEIYHDVLADAVVTWRNRHNAQHAVREAERRRRRAFEIATAALMALVLVAAIAVYAFVERGRSRSQAQRAHARELAAAATRDMDIDPQLGLREALQAARLERGLHEEQVLRDALLAENQRAVMKADGPVRIAQFDPHGGLVVTGSKDGRVRVYRTGASKPGLVLSQGGSVTAAHFSSDGRLLLTAGRDGSARLWTRKGVLLRRLVAGGPVRSAFFGDGARLVVTLADTGVIRVWQAADGKLLRTITTEGKAIPLGGSVDEAGDRLATFAHDRFARVYSLTSGALVRSFEQNGLVHCALFSPRGARLITCGHEGTVRVWSTTTGRLMKELRGPEPGSAILDGAFSPNGLFVAAAVADGTGRVWDTKSGAQLAVMFGHANPATRVAFSPTGHAIATGSPDSRARTWLANGKPVSIMAGHTGGINSVAFSPNGRLLLTAGEDGTARLWISWTEADLALVARQPPITAFALSPDGKRVVVGDVHGIARVRLVGRKRVVASIRTRGSVTAVAFGPHGAVAAARPTLSLAVSQRGDRVASGLSDGTVRIRTTSTGFVRVLRPGDGRVTAVAFSPDTHVLATGGLNGVIRLWNLRTGKRLRSFSGHRLGITSLAFSPDGRLLLSAGLDHTARTWDVATGRAEHVRLWHFGPLGGASFSSDGLWVVTAGPSAVGVGQVSSDQPLLRLRGAAEPFVGAGFAGSNGRLIVAASKDGTIRQYRCDICGTFDELLALATRRLRPR